MEERKVRVRLVIHDCGLVVAVDVEGRTHNPLVRKIHPTNLTKLIPCDFVNNYESVCTGFGVETVNGWECNRLALNWCCNGVASRLVRRLFPIDPVYETQTISITLINGHSIGDDEMLMQSTHLNAVPPHHKIRGWTNALTNLIAGN